MLCITVAQDGSGDFASISEAVLAVPYDCPAQIRIGAGIYRENWSAKKGHRPAGCRGGLHPARVGGRRQAAPPGWAAHPYISQLHGVFSGERLRVEDLTIENDAGPGAKAGQAVAAYVDSAHAVFEKVRLLGNQDTLFCAPLPEKEREKDGFLGPRGLAPRRASAQYYHDCEIAGDIDFIFGGADALFEQCVLRTVNNGLPHSWVTAPSGSAEGLGFVFWDCDFVSDSCPQGTVYLGRPWRPTGKRRCWPAVWGPTLPRRALRAGTTAPTRTLPGLPRPATLAQGPARAGRGCRHWTKHRPGRCCALHAGGAARNNNKKGRTYE